MPKMLLTWRSTVFSLKNSFFEIALIILFYLFNKIQEDLCIRFTGEAVSFIAEFFF